MIEYLVSVQRWLYQSMASGMGEASHSGVSFFLLAMATGFGSLHALMPGHGKAVLISYHVANPGRLLGGLLNGAVLVLAHVGSAIVLVLAGIAVIRASFGRSAQTTAIEIASAVLVITVGLWLLSRSVRGHHGHTRSSGPVLAFVTGLTPCPLTTFIMTYAIVNDVVAAGLLTSAAMAVGMVGTIGGFALVSIAASRRLTDLVARTEVWRRRIGSSLEAAGALGVIAIGTVSLIQRLPT